MKKRELDHSKYRDWIDPNEVQEYPRNAKKHDDKQIRNIANSIRRFGWQQDTVLTTDNVLVIGHGRRLAALKLGCEMPYHRIDKAADEVTDEDIRELRIADNQTNAETGFDFEMLSEDIEDLNFDGFDFDLTSGSYESAEENADGGCLVDNRKEQVAVKIVFASVADWRSNEKALRELTDTFENATLSVGANNEADESEL